MDKNETVSEVREVYADYFPFSSDFFSLEILHRGSLHPEGREEMNRTVEGLSALMLSLNIRPLIRYQNSSSLCKRISFELNDRLQSYSDVLRSSSLDGDIHLVILDRIEDPVTPLLSQWTYQAMIHELIGMDFNIVEMTTKTADKSSDSKNNKVSVSEKFDPFFDKAKYMNFGDLASQVKDLLDDFRSKSKTDRQVDSLDDLHDLVSRFPELLQESGMVRRHVSLVTELGNIVEARSLMRISAFEQALLCEMDSKSAANDLEELISNMSISFYDNLRLLLLFSLRFEQDVSGISNLRQSLESRCSPSEHKTLNRVTIFFLFLSFLCKVV